MKIKIIDFNIKNKNKINKRKGVCKKYILKIKGVARESRKKKEALLFVESLLYFIRIVDSC